MNRTTAAIFALLLAGSLPTTCLAASYQPGVTTEDDVSIRLGQPDSFTLQPDGSYVYVYQVENSCAILNVFPFLGFAIPTGTTTLTFTFDASTHLTSYSAS
jgi:hypothetical protein